MSGSVNKVIIVGNCARDPETRSMQDGNRIANLTVATSESWKDQNSGERKERSEFHRIVIFNERLAEVAEKYLKKGSKVYLEGQLQTRSWTDQAGVERYTTEIVLNRFRGELTMLDSAGGGKAAQGGSYSNEDGSGPPDTPRSRGATPRAATRVPATDLDDEIPFLTCDPAFEPYLKRRIVV